MQSSSTNPRSLIFLLRAWLKTYRDGRTQNWLINLSALKRILGSVRGQLLDGTPFKETDSMKVVRQANAGAQASARFKLLRLSRFFLSLHYTAGFFPKVHSQHNWLVIAKSAIVHPWSAIQAPPVVLHHPPSGRRLFVTSLNGRNT